MKDPIVGVQCKAVCQVCGGAGRFDGTHGLMLYDILNELHELRDIPMKCPYCEGTGYAVRLVSLRELADELIKLSND